MLKFSIIILNWNGLHHLKRFLPSVAATDYPDHEIILADNHSSDGSLDWAKRHHPQIRILAFDDNYGYCGGNNRAAREADGDVLVFLNNDVSVDAGWLRPLSRLFGKHPQMAAAQPKMLSVERPDTFEYAGAAGGCLDRLGYPWCRGRVFDRLEKDGGQYDAYPERIFWASGAAFCVRKDVFLELGGFEKSFEFHMEEIDLCWRMQRAGHHIRYCPQSVVWHLGAGSLEKDSPRKTHYNFRNNLVMLTRNYPGNGLFFILLVRFFLDLLAALSFLASGKSGSSRAVIKAWTEFITKLPAHLETRGKLLEELPLNVPLDGFRPVSILWEYFRGKQ